MVLPDGLSGRDDNLRLRPPSRFYIDVDYVFPMSGNSQLFGSIGNTGIPIL